MRIFTNHCGNYHKTNTALVVLTSLYVIGAAVALSSPYWVSSTCMLAPLAAFAATPLGIGILATVAVALVGLAVYAISRNNKISELNAPKIVVGEKKEVVLLVTKEVHEEMKKNNQIKNEKDNVEEGKCYIDFSLEGKNYRIIVNNLPDKGKVGNALLLSISSLEVKNEEGKFGAVNATEWNKTLGLDKDNAKEVNTYLGSLIVEQVTQQNGAKK